MTEQPTNPHAHAESHNGVEHPHPAHADPAALALSRELPDISLLVGIRQRDAQALGLLYDRYGALMYTIALRSTGDRKLAEEVVLDVFQVVWQFAGACPVNEDIRAWMIGIVRQQAIDTLRARSKHLAPHSRGPEPLNVAGAGESADRTAAPAIHGAAPALPADQRAVVELMYYSGLTRAEIAVRLNQSLSTVTSYLRQGLSTLRARLRAGPNDPR